MQEAVQNQEHKPGRGRKQTKKAPRTHAATNRTTTTNIQAATCTTTVRNTRSRGTRILNNLTSRMTRILLRSITITGSRLATITGSRLARDCRNNRRALVRRKS
jgi:hypothetical protein